MPSPIVNETSNQKFFDDELIIDECGPFLLAKFNENFCYTWYKIDPKTNIHTLISDQHNSWLSLTQTQIDSFKICCSRSRLQQQLRLHPNLHALR